MTSPAFIGPSELTATTVVCHVGVGPGARDRYLGKHLVDARYLDLETDLSAPPGPVVGRHPLPTPGHFAKALAREGIGHGQRVAAYDDRGGAYAARLVWMLRMLGQPASLLLLGPRGLDALPTAKASKTAANAAALVKRSAIPWPQDALADAPTVADHLAAGGLVIDSRDAQRYRGEVEPIDKAAGHIPGAVNLAHRGIFEGGQLLHIQRLRDRFRAVTAAPEGTIVYCGSGVTACINALAIEHAGLPAPRLYVGSWSGWSTDPQRPVATGG